MAYIHTDGFDKYGPIGMNIVSGSVPQLTDLLQAGEWSSTSTIAGSMSIVAGLSSPGTALKMGVSVGGTSDIFVGKTFGTVSRTVGGFRFQVDNLASPVSIPLYITLFKSGTAQFSATVNLTTGAISARTGPNTGTALGTSSSTTGTGVAHFIEWDVTIGASASYNVYLDGTSIVSGTGNTRGDGANNNCDSVRIGITTNSAASLTIDDLYLFDTSGSFNNAVLNTNPRVETQYSTGDNTTAFSFGAGILGTRYYFGGVNAPGANQLYLRRFIAPIGETLNSISMVPQGTSGTAKFKGVVYSDSTGSPGTLLSSGTEVVGCTSGTVLTGALVTPQTLTQGTAYWIGFIADTSVNLNVTDSTTTGVRVAATYTSGAPSTPTGFTTAQNSWAFWGNTTGATTNWTAVRANPPVGDTSFVYSSTATTEDLYTFPALTVTPQTIHLVVLKAYGRNSDGGSRTVDLRMKSSSTDDGGQVTGMTFPISYSWKYSPFPQDPATSAAWTKSGLDAALAGPKVAS